MCKLSEKLNTTLASSEFGMGLEAPGTNPSQTPVSVTLLSHAALVNLHRRTLPNPRARLQWIHPILLRLL